MVCVCIGVNAFADCSFSSSLLVHLKADSEASIELPPPAHAAARDRLLTLYTTVCAWGASEIFPEEPPAGLSFVFPVSSLHFLNLLASFHRKVQKELRMFRKGNSEDSTSV